MQPLALLLRVTISRRFHLPSSDQRARSREITAADALEPSPDYVSCKTLSTGSKEWE